MHQTMSDHLILPSETSPELASGTSINRAKMGSIRAIRAMHMFMRAGVILSRILSHDRIKECLTREGTGFEMAGQCIRDNRT